MSRKLVVGVAVSATLALSGAFAPGAGASSHFRMLAFKPCNAVLAAADFMDGLEEIAPTSVTSAGGTTASVSSCKYASTAEEGLGSIASFTKGEIGIECLASALKIVEAGGTPPPGDCYRIDNVSVLFARGRPVERLASKLAKGVKARTWRVGYARHILPGVGNRAEFGYNDGGDGYGYLQVDNANVFVETTEGASLITLLKNAAATL